MDRTLLRQGEIIEEGENLLYGNSNIIPEIAIIPPDYRPYYDTLSSKNGPEPVLALKEKTESGMNVLWPPVIVSQIKQVGRHISSGPSQDRLQPCGFGAFFDTTTEKYYIIHTESMWTALYVSSDGLNWTMIRTDLPSITGCSGHINVDNKTITYVTGRVPNDPNYPFEDNLRLVNGSIVTINISDERCPYSVEKFMASRGTFTNVATDAQVAANPSAIRSFLPLPAGQHNFIYPFPSEECVAPPYTPIVYERTLKRIKAIGKIRRSADKYQLVFVLDTYPKSLVLFTNQTFYENVTEEYCIFPGNSAKGEFILSVWSYVPRSVPPFYNHAWYMCQLSEAAINIARELAPYER